MRFDGLLRSLSRNAELVDREASSHDIVAAYEWRETTLRDIHDREEQQATLRFTSVLAWLDIKDRHQQDELYRLQKCVCADTCDWILRQTKVASWLLNNAQHRVLWLHGIPGSGLNLF